MIIKELSAKKIKDSRSDFTIEVSVNGFKASSPSGKSKGIHETPSYRKSIDWNVNFLNKFEPDIEINAFPDLRILELLIKQKAKIKNVKQFGANALFALESAVLKALAKSKRKELWEIINPRAKRFPIPLGNAIGGGLHSKNKNKPSFQEFLIIPKSNSPEKNFAIMKEIYNKLKRALSAKTKNDEGAWQTSLNEEQLFEILTKFNKIRTGTDVAASSFYKKGEYCYKNKSLDRKSQIFYINSLINKFNLLYVEDPLQEEDFSGFSKIRKQALVTGDDLTASQIPRLKKAIKMHSINAMIIKPNQNGSLLEVKEIFGICKRNRIKTILSHRSGETLDTAIADLAFGFQADYIKTGVSTKWREAKLKRLIAIEKSLRI